jgi:hypothetical protein
MNSFLRLSVQWRLAILVCLLLAVALVLVLPSVDLPWTEVPRIQLVLVIVFFAVAHAVLVTTCTFGALVHPNYHADSTCPPRGLSLSAIPALRC